MKIKAYVFDLGGVVLTHKKEVTLKILAKIFNKDLQEISNFYKTLEDDWVTGKIKDKEVVYRFKTRFSSNQSIDEILNTWEKHYEKITKVNKEVLQLVDDLRTQGYKVYLLSDTTDLHHRLNLKRDLFDHFDQVFASFIEGKRKTKTDFFEHFLEQTGLEPIECFFIDDRKENLKIARQVGMHSILFKNYQDLSNTLKRYLN